jgi:LmbE family N-acetylglucosaminyl deacetylase
LCRLVSDYRTAALAFESPYTRRDSPPLTEQVVPGSAYRGDDVERELGRIIASFKPTVVLMPSARDEHPDHCSTHLMVHSALAAAAALDPQVAPRVLHFLIHYGAWPDANAPDVLPPAHLLAGDLQWRSLSLAPRETAAKKQALASYGSQMLAIGPLMKAFDRANELFIEGDTVTIAPCWCRGQDVAAGRVGPASRLTPQH